MNVLKKTGLLEILALAGLATGAAAQDTIGSAIGVFVFPADGQEAAEQSRDEAECYTWATERTRSDPFELMRQSAREESRAEYAAERAQSVGQGAAASGAVAGAAGGALIGRVFGSKNTARSMARVGAVTGAASGAAARQDARAQAGRAAQQAAGRAEATEAQINDFRKAFSACLEANDYVARF